VTARFPHYLASLLNEALKPSLLMLVLDRQCRLVVADAVGNVDLPGGVFADVSLHILSNVVNDALLEDVIVGHAPDGIAVLSTGAGSTGLARRLWSPSAVLIRPEGSRPSTG
jgi:hypothetical protein